jgi:HSP20 family protein
MEEDPMVNQFPVTPNYVLLRDAMQHLLDDSVVPTSGRPGPSTTARTLPLDVYATPDEVVILAAIPGMDPHALEITYSQNTVTLAGTMPSATESADGQRGTWYLSELWHGQFRRTVSLPFEVDVDQAAATFDRGIVRIVLPKAAWTKPQKIAIRTIDGTKSAGTPQVPVGVGA